MVLLSLALAVVLLVFPGAWVSFGMSLGGAPWRVRLALAVALSPAVVAALGLGLRLLGLPFGLVAVLCVVASLPSVVLVIRHLRRQGGPRPRWAHVPGAALLALLVLCAATPSLYAPQYRAFGRHGLMQAEVCSPSLPAAPARKSRCWRAWGWTTPGWGTCTWP